MKSKCLAQIFSIVLVSGCSNASDERHDVAQSANNGGRATIASHDCPSESLSCGKQVPQISDGKTAFINKDMKISAMFPVGEAVCLARSGDAARGFYSEYGSAENPCSENSTPTRFMSISASFNSADYQSVREAAAPCPPVTSSIFKSLDVQTLAIAGYETITCENVSKTGLKYITLYSLAGTNGIALKNKAMIYRASFSTDAASAGQEIPKFKAFVRALRIGDLHQSP